MQKKFSFWVLIMCIAGLPSFALAFSVKDTIDTLYKNVSGFGISTQDEEVIIKHGGASTYGEITYEGVEQLLKQLSLTKNDVFYDLGSGIGKMVVQVYLSTPVKKSVGIELSAERSQKAALIYEQFKKEGHLKQQRTLALLQENFLESDLSDATIIYMASTCFSPEFMEKVTKKLASLKKGLRVITLKKLAENPRFTLLKELTLPMTWSAQTTAYIYELQ